MAHLGSKWITIYPTGVARDITYDPLGPSCLAPQGLADALILGQRGAGFNSWGYGGTPIAGWFIYD